MNNIKLVIKSLSKRKLSVLFVSLQVVTSILFLISIACTFQKIFYFDITVHKNIKPNASQIIHVKINADSATPEKYFSFRGQILKQSGIDSMGYFNTNNTVIFSTLANSPELKKMKSEQKDILGIPEEFSAVKIEKGLQELKSLQIVEGRNFENTDFSSDNLIVPILVGYNFIKYNVVNIGDELYDSNNKKKYKVIGALKERSTWFMSSLSDGVLEYLDNKIVIASNDGDYFPFIQGMMKSSYYCIVKSSKTVPKIMTNMIEIANKEGLSVEVRTISDELKKYQQEIINENIKWLIFSLFLY
ncbi:ABC transporter permease [Ruminiclostridium josui]|uniref:ABC transporter permease n=1 Tax=Ruminiclostridium josui TaxID=1499 RepID=UPI0006CF2C92|nr:hypothetical protein [Ruminiclostridium josui]